MLLACPYLPPAPIAMDWRDMAAQRAERGIRFYVTALTYGQYLWQRRLPARALLCLDRAMGAELRGDEAELQRWPMPYAAVGWVLENTPTGLFIGNPRVHFQHYAGRMNEPRREQRRWRAWACWAIARRVWPQLPGDPRHAVEEPDETRVEAELARHGLPGELALWKTAYASLLRAENSVAATDSRAV